MKKQYVKPVIEMESFRFSQSIASACSAYIEGSANTGDVNSCAWEQFGMSYFVSSSACLHGELEGVCYNAPTEGMGVFSVS